jgi:hypothetical protein
MNCAGFLARRSVYFTAAGIDRIEQVLAKMH